MTSKNLSDFGGYPDHVMVRLTVTQLPWQRIVLSGCFLFYIGPSARR